MALLEDLGVLSTAQDLTSGDTDSENIIDLGAIADVGYEDMYLDIVCETAKGSAAGSTSTYMFDLVVATAANLTTNKSVVRIVIQDVVADPRIAAVNRQIAAIDVGAQIASVMDATYRFLGLISSLGDGNSTASVSINAAMSSSKPRTRDDVQVTRSNVSLPT